MQRLTKREENKAWLIKGNFDFQAVKEAVEKLCVLEEWFEKQNIDVDLKNLNNFHLQASKKEKSKTNVKSNFKPYLILKNDVLDFFIELEKTFCKSGNFNEEFTRYGFIGEDTELKDFNGKELKVGDLVYVEEVENHEGEFFGSKIVKEKAIVVKNENESFVMGFADLTKNMKNGIAKNSLLKFTKFRDYTEIKNNEKFSNVVAILEENEGVNYGN